MGDHTAAVDRLVPVRADRLDPGQPAPFFAASSIAGNDLRVPASEPDARPRWTLLVSGALFFTIIPACCLYGQTVETALITGRVVSPEGAPLAEAEVTVPTLGRLVRTLRDGGFRLADLPPGRVTVGIRAVGFKPSAFDIDIGAGDTLVVEFTLEHYVQRLDSLTTTAPRQGSWSELSDIDRRRRATLGVFLSREDLERWRDHPLTRALQRSGGGVRAVPRRSGGTALVSMRGTGLRGGDCPLGVWLDGVYQGTLDPVPTLGMAPEPIDIDQYRPDRLEAVEVYRGGVRVPAQFQGPGSECGVVVLWTRRK
jgi:hypothetical protein